MENVDKAHLNNITKALDEGRLYYYYFFLH